MRVSTSQIFNSGTTGLQNLQYGLYKVQNQLSTGRKVLSPQDDPVAASQALEVTQAKGVNQQYMDNQASATSSLNYVDSTLSSVNDELQNIYEKAVQAGNGSYSAAQRGMIADELKSRMQDLIALANTKDGTGKYIFSGYKTTTQPFSPTNPAANAGAHALGATTYVTYNGDNGNPALQVSQSQVMNTGENGADVFMQVKDSSGNVVGRSMFDSLQNMIDILDPSSGVPFSTTAYNQALGDISSSINQVGTVRASVGARLQSLSSQTSTGQDNALQYDSRLSQLQDLDYTAAISQLSNYQFQLQAAQLSFKQTSQLSLFNIL